MQEINKTIRKFLESALPSFKLIDGFVDEMSQVVEQKEYPAGTVLLNPGEYCKYIYIIQEGFARRYTLNEGKDITLEFAQENEMITSLYSITTDFPTLDYIEILEDSQVLELKVSDLKKLYESSTDSLVIGKSLRDKYFLSLEKRILSLQISSAKERYENLIKNQPGIIQRASLGQIASYLGIAQETLSRIRRKI